MNLDEVAIVANGPSLKGKYDLLDQLADRDIFTYGVNRCMTVFPKTRWRPDMVVITDANRSETLNKDVKWYLDNGFQLLTTDLISYLLNRDGMQLEWWDLPNFEPFVRCVHRGEMVPLEWHIPHICAYGGSTFAAIQHAVFEHNVKRIELWGADFHYREGTDNHFVDFYMEGERGETWSKTEAVAKNEEMKRAWEIAQAECKKLGVTIERLGLE